MTRDYVRDGTATLFAALNLLEGKVIGRCMRAPTSCSWLNAVEDFFAKLTRRRDWGGSCQRIGQDR